MDHAVLSVMKKQGSGVILHVGSVTGFEGCVGNIGYATAKSGAMNGLTKSISMYGAQFGVRCVCVSPGPVLTRPGMKSMKTLSGRAAEPIEVVNTFLYLASEEGSFYNGVNLLMDGGRSIMYSKEG